MNTLAEDDLAQKTIRGHMSQICRTRWTRNICSQELLSVFKQNRQETSEEAIRWDKEPCFFPEHTQSVVKLGDFFTKIYINQRNAVLPYEKENSFVLHKHLIRQLQFFEGQRY